MAVRLAAAPPAPGKGQLLRKKGWPFVAFRSSGEAAAASHRSWAQTFDRTARSAPGREAALAKLEHEVDPDGLMSERDRLKAAENLRKARLYEAAQASVAARAERKRAERDAKKAKP